MASLKRELSFSSVEIYYDEVLGIGAYGKVYKAKCGQLPCAAKLLHDTLFLENDPGTHNLTSKFLQECQFLSTIKHPNVVQCLSIGSDPQSRRPVLLMELMDESLTKHLETSTGALPYHSQVNICHDVALALAYLHSNVIIHRDLSSNNVLLIGEGSRAKVTDFGMSKLMDMNPRMTPLTQVPGTPAYMPPEALTMPPRYSSQLDCFSHGVLAIQINTREFPNPGDATITIEDSRFPTGVAFVPIPESERRKKDISLVEHSHPLLPIALDCLKDRDTERPSANELCERLASLKREPRYIHSTEHTKQHIQRLQKEIGGKNCELESKRTEHERAIEENQHTLEQLHECRDRLREKEEMIQRLQEQVEAMHLELEQQQFIKEEGVLSNEVHDVQGGKELGDLLSAHSLELRWRQGEAAPENMLSLNGAAVVHRSNAYFAYQYNSYCYSVPEDRWTKLPASKCIDFALAVINGKLTTIGGCYLGTDVKYTNTLLSLSGGFWEEFFPPMPTNRLLPAAINTPSYLVVAGGRQGFIIGHLSTVEVLNTETLQWSIACSLPETAGFPQMTLCDGSLYLSNHNKCFTSSVDELLKSCELVSTDSNDGGSVWTRLANIPMHKFSLATLCGRVLAIGGIDDVWGGNRTGAIHCYDATANSWSVVGEMPTPRSQFLAAVLPSNQLVVVGGKSACDKFCSVTDICSFFEEQ